MQLYHILTTTVDSGGWTKQGPCRSIPGKTAPGIHCGGGSGRVWKTERFLPPPCSGNCTDRAIPSLPICVLHLLRQKVIQRKTNNEVSLQLSMKVCGHCIRVFQFPQFAPTTHFFVSWNCGSHGHENKRQDRLKRMTKKLRSANYLYRGHDTKRTLTIPCCHIGQFVTHHWMSITGSIISHYQKQRWWWWWWCCCWLHTCNDVAIIRPAREAPARTHALSHTHTAFLLGSPVTVAC